MTRRGPIFNRKIKYRHSHLTTHTLNSKINSFLMTLRSSKTKSISLQLSHYLQPKNCKPGNKFNSFIKKLHSCNHLLGIKRGTQHDIIINSNTISNKCKHWRMLLTRVNSKRRLLSTISPH